MDWLRRVGRASLQEDSAEEPEKVGTPAPDPPVVERAAPGITALFAGLKEDGSHAVLDLGPSAGSNFTQYSRFARRIRFADLLTAPTRGETWASALTSLPSAPEPPFDLVLAWNLLDRVQPKSRPLVVECLAKLTRPGSRLHVVVDVSGEPIVHPIPFVYLK